MTTTVTIVLRERLDQNQMDGVASMTGRNNYIVILYQKIKSLYVHLGYYNRGNTRSDSSKLANVLHFKKIYLFERLREKEINTERTIFQLLVHLLYGCC